MHRIASPALMIVAAAALAYTMVAGYASLSEAAIRDFDTQFWFVAGAAWWQGLSPYEFAAFEAVWNQRIGPLPPDLAFVYPGTMLPVSLVLGSLPWEAARWLMRLGSTGALVGSLLLVRGVIRRAGALPVSASVRDGWLAAAFAVPAAGLALHQGQPTLLVLLGLCLAWSGYARSSTPAIAAGFVLAGIKPQLSLVPLLFLASCYPTRRTWWGVGAAGVVGAAVFAWSSPAILAADLGESLAVHMGQTFNQLGRYDSLVSLLGGTGLGRLGTFTGIVLGCLAAVGLGRGARAADFVTRLRLLQLAVALTSAAMPLHRYDLVIDALLLATAWTLGSRRRAVTLAVLVLAHGRAFWIGRKLVGRIDMGMASLDFYSLVASLLGGAVLAFLLWCWWRDHRGASVTKAT